MPWRDNGRNHREPKSPAPGRSRAARAPSFSDSAVPALGQGPAARGQGGFDADSGATLPGLNALFEEPSMGITVTCPSCGRNGHAPEAMRGKTVRCPACKKPFQVEEPR